MAKGLLSVTCFTLTDVSMKEIELNDSVILPREADWTMATNESQDFLWSYTIPMNL